ncbi:MAG: RnfABCDGE type electron transport complex subunit D [Planctomycetota bacterium]
MAETVKAKPEASQDGGEAMAPAIHVAPGPHIKSRTLTTQKMMFDVLLALVPVVGMAIYIFRGWALLQIGICVAAAMATEAAFTWIRHRKIPLWDGSAAVTGLILGLSLPWQADWYIGVLGAVVAVGLGKFVFGGLGYNMFNPAMVGRAFVTIAFPVALGLSGYVVTPDQADAPEPPTRYVTEATPMSAAKNAADKRAEADRKIDEAEAASDEVPSTLRLLVGNTNGSLGEVSAIACLLGGLYLVIRRTASWEIPLGILVMVAALAGLVSWGGGDVVFTPADHLLGGALLFGAFFIATDPVSSPLTPWGKFGFGLIIGFVVMVLRLFSGYPEGVQFAVLFANALVPLLNRWTIPRPVGGFAPQKG